MNQHPRNEICNETPQSELWSGICAGYWAPAVPGRGLASGGARSAWPRLTVGPRSGLKLTPPPSGEIR